MGYADLHQQGVFALVSNLGSLVARLVLQPVEEVVFAHYSQLAASARLAKRRTIGLNALRRMHALLRAAAIFGGLFLAFGPPYSWLLLRLLYGTKWTTGTNAPTLLGAYCLHVMMMAINGIGEAYVNATATEAELTRLSRYMVLLAIVYLPAAALSLKFAGSVGLVLANALNMVARAAYAYTTLTAATNAAAVQRPCCRGVGRIATSCSPLAPPPPSRCSSAPPSARRPIARPCATRCMWPSAAAACWWLVPARGSSSRSCWRP